MQPAIATLGGELEADRATVSAWAEAGATHLLLRAGLQMVPAIARDLAPEAAMPDFPRIVAESPLPLPCPRAT